jgi:RNA-directed DNA polymerase
MRNLFSPGDEVMREPVTWLVDLELAQFCDTMPQAEMLAVLSERLVDRTFLRLIGRMLKAGVQPPGGIVQDERGSPQGSIVSPVIANAFLDHVLDQWGVGGVRRYCHGYGHLLRYADDALAGLETEDDARRLRWGLPLRLGTCGRRRSGKARRKRKMSKKRLRRAVVELNPWLRQARSARKLPDLWQAVAQKMPGHCQDFGVTDNSRVLYLFAGKGTSSCSSG